VSAGQEALEKRDRALAALDEGDPQKASELAQAGLAVLAAAGQGGGLDEAALLIAIAEIEERLDRFAAAGESLGTAIRLLGTDDGPDRSVDDADVVLLWCQAQEQRAGLERLGGDFAGASSRLTRVLDIATEEFGEASMAVVAAANALGVVHKHAGELDAATAAYERAMAAAQELTDRDRQVEAVLLHNLGGLAHSRGDAETGIPLAERGLALRIEQVGDDHPDVAADLNALSALYHLAGRFKDASEAGQRALVIFERCYGANHFEVAMTCANLAVVAADQDEFSPAEDLHQRSLRILTAVLGPDDAEVGLTKLNLAVAVAGQGRLVEAAALAADAETILSDRLPAGHPHLAAAGNAVAKFKGQA
jgi:tetratricopeptide (TPR) repeat protein